MTAAACAAFSSGVAPKWVGDLISEILARTTTEYPPSPGQLTRLILTSKTFEELRGRGALRTLEIRAVTLSPKFAPISAFRCLGVPELATVGALTQWLDLPYSQVAWLADVEGYRAVAASELTHHYRHTWISRRSGPPRLIEAPKPFLKSIQRQILHGILDKVPGHDCAHGYRKGRSCITAAQRHAGETIVVAVDLKDFFVRIPIRQVHGIFRCLGYPWSVARVLTALCSTTTPPEVFGRLPTGPSRNGPAQDLYRQRHLPQGAPTSPALANQCAWRLDCRLNGLASRLNANYTRYADDLAFSGDAEFAHGIDRFLPAVAAICRDAGFLVNDRKTRVMGQAGRQSYTGLVVNQHVNIPRERYDALKAILWNCVRHGPDSQNRDGHPEFRSHLDGRVTWFENVNRKKGHRLRLLFQRIRWP